MAKEVYDIAIIGGGPAGSTLGTLLKKYEPSLEVGIFEREVFPRDHVGESLLPPIAQILYEMGCWDKVEAANFPVKIGATYRWGKSHELWDLDFIPPEQYVELPRPGEYKDQRRFTAWQVDRSIYDHILLDHAAESGCHVRQGLKVAQIDREGDRISGLNLDSGDTVEARYYVDASGNSGILRRAMGVNTEYPTSLKNIAIWDYWQNADWAVKIGVGGTRIRVLSLPYGWLWFIPLGATRTSLGLVIPAEYYKNSGKKPEELYAQALLDESSLHGLLKNATQENKLQTTKDWSFLSERLTGENWFLVGECAGFADPILSAGLSLAHSGARELAYTILELDKRNFDSDWLKEQYSTRQRERITNHIRFADFWYCSNAQLKNLKEFTATLAKDSGLDLSPEKAWDWIGKGGFVQGGAKVGAGDFTLAQVKNLGAFLSDVKSSSSLNKYNVFRLNLENAVLKEATYYEAGAITETEAYFRDDHVLPLQGSVLTVVNMLRGTNTMQGVIVALSVQAEPLRPNPEARTLFLHSAMQALEAMIADGWVVGSHDPSQPLEDISFVSKAMHWNVDPVITA